MATGSVVSRTAPVTPASPQGGGTALHAGQTLVARVVEVKDNGLVRLATRDAFFDVKPTQPLTVGARVMLQVEGSGNAIKLVMHADPQAMNGGGRQAITPTPISARNAQANGIQSGATVPNSGTTATQTTPNGVGTQGTNTAAARPSASMPTPPVSVSTTSASPATTPPQPVTYNQFGQSSAVPRATADGTVMRAAVPGGDAKPSGTTPAQAPVQSVQRQALSEMVHAAVGRQNGLAPLFANLAQASGSPAPLPDTVTRAMEQLLGLRVSATNPPSAETVKTAIAQSGIFQEARLATPNPPPAGDMKSSLLMLRNVLRSVLGGDPVPATTSDRPPPPRRNALPQGQRPAPANLPQTMAPQEMMRVLLAQTEAALDRLRLTQFASRPDDGDGHTARAAATSEWTLEIPLALGAQTAIAQFRIDRDGGNDQDEKVRQWTVRFSIDIDPLGPIHAQIVLTAGDVAVTLWAERPETADKLTENATDLRSALDDADLAVDDIQMRAGSPNAAPRTAGAMVDQKT